MNRELWGQRLCMQRKASETCERMASPDHTGRKFSYAQLSLGSNTDRDSAR